MRGHGAKMMIPIAKYRKSPLDREWELPPWGHPLSRGVLPLFVTFEGRLFPVGTAFTIGRGVVFVVSAAHNVREAWKFEERLSHLLFKDELPSSIELQEVGLSILYQRPEENGDIEVTIWPLETGDGAPPTDIVFASPKHQTVFPTLVHRLSFDLPTVGERVWSIGYCDFKYPEDGIPLADIEKNTFDWQRDYGHKLLVVEGKVERIFTQQFARRFIEGRASSSMRRSSMPKAAAR